MQTGQEEIWKDIAESAIPNRTDRLHVLPSRYRTLTLNGAKFPLLLAQIPSSEKVSIRTSGFRFALPLPTGGFAHFRWVQSTTMEPELQSKFPGIKTYEGQGLDPDYTSASFDVSPKGFHAVMNSNEGTIYIDPYLPGDTIHYISYFKRDLPSVKKQPFEVTDSTK